MALRWFDLYDEAQLYKAAVRLYTTPLFNWRKALGTSFDLKNFYDFARHGLPKLVQIHEKLKKCNFRYRPGKAIDFNFNGKLRTVYVYPWEERLIDLLLYRLLNRSLNKWFSGHSYAYRLGCAGLDVCQRNIELSLRAMEKPVFIIKRDIVNYFNSVNHEILVKKLSVLVDPQDYLFSLLKERIEFHYYRQSFLVTARQGIPFGTAIACVFANIYLTEIDHALSRIKGLRYFRYSDDIIFFSRDKQVSLLALEVFNCFLNGLKLSDKERQRKNIIFSNQKIPDEFFSFSNKFKHLGLEFHACGLVGLSRDKFRKICNIFKFALRRKKAKVKKVKDIEKKIAIVINVINQALDSGIRNIAIVDYYLKHVSDQAQIKLLDRWLAEEALAVILGSGHKKGNFKKITFKTLRAKGLPSLAHRRSLLLHGYLESSFFIWKNNQVSKARKGTAARPLAAGNRLGQSVFSPFPVAAAALKPCEKEALPVDGRY